MKIPILNLYYLLCYAWDMLEEGKLVDVSHESFRSLPELFARVLNTGVAHLLRRGLDRSYLREEDDLRSPRGKFDLSATAKRTLLLRSRIHCVYDTFSHDVLHNQIVKATLGRLARWKEFEPILQQESVRLHRRFHDISDTDLSLPIFDRVVLHRNNRFYAFLIEVCRVLYLSLLVDPVTGQSSFRDFLRDEQKMARVFERFILNFYKREQTAYYSPRSEVIRWKDVEGSPDDQQLLPKMKTDVTLRSRSSARTIVIDTKYYASSLQTSYFGKATVHSSDLYQLFAYLKNLENDKPAKPLLEGILLYPAVDRPLDLQYRIHGLPVRVATVNLNQPWPAIKSRLLGLIE